jgi:hypothetical protein
LFLLRQQVAEPGIEYVRLELAVDDTLTGDFTHAVCVAHQGSLIIV